MDLKGIEMENELENLDLVTKAEKQVAGVLVEECCGDPTCTCDDELVDEIVEDESLRNEDGHDYQVGYSMEDGASHILCEAAITATQELNFITQLGSECRKNLFDLILKSDLDKEKIIIRIAKLQEFLMTTEARTDQLVERIERLVNTAHKGTWTCNTKSQ